MRGWKKRLSFYAAKKLTYSAIWWQQMGTQFPQFALPQNLHCAPLLVTERNNQSPFHQSHFQYVGHHKARMATCNNTLVMDWLLFDGSYLRIVLKHLIALHVVTLEHDDGSVEAGDVQTEVICPNFFIRCVCEHLETRCLSQNWALIIILHSRNCGTGEGLFSFLQIHYLILR